MFPAYGLDSKNFHIQRKNSYAFAIKSLVLSRVDNGSQLWSPHQKQHICLIEKIQRSFTKHIDGRQALL